MMYELISAENRKKIRTAADTLLFEGNLKSSDKEQLNKTDLLLILKYPEEFKEILRIKLADTDKTSVQNKIDKMQTRINAAFKALKDFPLSCLFFYSKKAKEIAKHNQDQLNTLKNEVEKAGHKTDKKHQQAQAEQVYDFLANI